jgi:hypothetical protein
MSSTSSQESGTDVPGAAADHYSADEPHETLLDRLEQGVRNMAKEHSDARLAVEAAVIAWRVLRR